MTVKNIIPEYQDPKERQERLQSTYYSLQRRLSEKKNIHLPERKPGPGKACE